MVTALVGLTVGATGAAVVASAATSGQPEVDRASATMQLSGTLKATSCLGEDQVKYLTYAGSWKGGETQVLPDPTDYSLSGSLTVTAVRWTINAATGRGVLTGKIGLSEPTGLPSYSGTLTLVSQGVPAAGAAVPARGWISGHFSLPDEGVTPGDDSLIANVEMVLSPTSANGQFGDALKSLGIPDYSAVTNVAPAAADGTC